MSFTDRLGLTIPQAVLAWVLVVLIGGAAGLLAMLICNYMLSFGGSDSASKHGISKVQASPRWYSDRRLHGHAFRLSSLLRFVPAAN